MNLQNQIKKDLTAAIKAKDVKKKTPFVLSWENLEE